jgi:ATP-binding cassette subfamily A (ABC1) protein 3
MSPDELPVRVNNLRKTFASVGDKTVVAVDKLSFGLEFGECFALLGTSGAGKTSTFKCLTAEETPSSGQLHISGFDMTTNKGFSDARKLIGYCPQFDAIFEGMTVKEHLEFYASIKGILKTHRA